MRYDTLWWYVWHFMMRCVTLHDEMCDTSWWDVWHYDEMYDTSWWDVWHFMIVTLHDEMCDISWLWHTSWWDVWHFMMRCVKLHDVMYDTWWDVWHFMIVTHFMMRCVTLLDEYGTSEVKVWPRAVPKGSLLLNPISCPLCIHPRSALDTAGDLVPSSCANLGSDILQPMNWMTMVRLTSS